MKSSQPPSSANAATTTKPLAEKEDGLVEVADVKVHVLVPAHGRADLLNTTLVSLVEGIVAGVRLTVVDDATPDDSVAQVARTLAVEYVRNGTQLGVAANFNRCLDLSVGVYTVIMGSDDVIDRSFLALLVGGASSPLLPTMITTRVRVIDGDGRPVMPLVDRIKGALSPRRGEGSRIVQGDSALATILAGNWLYFPAIAWRTENARALRFRTDMTTAMDLDLIARLLLDGGSILRLDTTAFNYRRHASSVSAIETQSGARFVEEEQVIRDAGRAARARHWWASSLMARLRPTHRLHRILVG